jgi:chaperone required for assembly of F1-ATPase
MKRFYETVHHDLKDNFYYFYLDNKPIKTPMGHLLSTQSASKADAVIHEWQTQTDTIIPENMPITKYLNTVHDKIIPHYVHIIKQLLDYADNDCIFYFTDKINSPLYDKQIQYWLPIIQHFAHYYAVDFNYGTSLILKNQPEDYKNHLKDLLESLSPDDLACLYTLITLLGSVLLALFAYHKHIDYDTALTYSRLEEDFNIQNWGFKTEIEKKRVQLNKDYKQAIMFLTL